MPVKQVLKDVSAMEDILPLVDAQAAFTIVIMRQFSRKGDNPAAQALEEMLSKDGRHMKRVRTSKPMKYKTYRKAQYAEFLPAYDIYPDVELPVVVRDAIGAKTLREALHGVTFDVDIIRCVDCGNVIKDGERCEMCHLHHDAFIMDERISLGLAPDFCADTLYANMDRMDELEDWIESIGGDEVLADMTDEEISAAFRQESKTVSVSTG